MASDFSFHPAVARWFETRFAAATQAQARAWPKIQAGGDVLVLSPTGSGKTLAAFLSAIDELVREGLSSQTGQLPDETRIIYVSPLKALVTDIEQNLLKPLAEIGIEIQKLGLEPPSITTFARTGDTPAQERAKRAKRPPHIYITTPESLYILLTSESGRASLRTARHVIVDEIHAFVPNKRGAHLSLSLARLDALCFEHSGQKPRRIGLSATQRPVEVVARFLVGSERALPAIVDETGPRTLDIGIVSSRLPLEAVMSADGWSSIYDQLAAFAAEHRTTLVFTNTRRLAERITRHLGERLGPDAVGCHHGSLSRERRAAAERRLKRGELKVLVATASLELGLDIGDVELVCQIGSPGRIATFLQRIGRARHQVGGVPKGRLFPLSRDDLVEGIALFTAIREGKLDQTLVPRGPKDVLLQQMVAEISAQPKTTTELYELARAAAPYSDLERSAFDGLVEVLSKGFSTDRGRRAAFLHYDSTSDLLRGRRGARLTAITNGGAIPDAFDYEVRLDPENLPIGSLHEDFAIEAMAGDIFQLGNASYRILKIEPGTVRVADAKGQPPTIPFWIGEAPSRSDELSRAVSEFRKMVDERAEDPELSTSVRDRAGIDLKVAEEAIEYLKSTRAVLGRLPTQTQLIAERFFDETEGMHVVLHAPFGARINRALGLALRKRFCRSFNVELQAAADDDAIVLSLGPLHAFPLEDLFQFLNPESALSVLEQATLDAPLFQTRFRWNASRALSILRFRGGKKVPPRFQRMDADDLLATCFPDQVACLENIQGDREIPDHPLVEQTLFDALHEAMDAEGFLAVLRDLKSGTIQAIARDVTEPSPAAHEILTARPYAFLDDAPLEERRTQAVFLRRMSGVDPASATLSQEAIDEVRAEIWPAPRDEDELHDVLGLYGYLSGEEGAALTEGTSFMDSLQLAQRASRALVGTFVFWVARERCAEFAAVHPDAVWSGRAPETREPDRNAAIVSLLRNRLEIIGPWTANEAARSLGVDLEEANVALSHLEAQGIVLRGSFRTPPGELPEYCEKRILARIHRRTVSELRKRIEPVSLVRYFEFLCEWQGVTETTRRRGLEGTRAVLKQLEGVHAPAVAWEKEILPARIADYTAHYLDQLCQSGEIIWRTSGSGKGSGSLKTTPLLLLPRASVCLPESPKEELVGADATRILRFLEKKGASFVRDIERGTGLLRAQTESALRELAARGFVTTDSFLGLRLLMQSQAERGQRARRSTPLRGLDAAGRISLVEADSREEFAEAETGVELICRILLARFGVVSRAVLDREQGLPGYRELIRQFHRLEARGEIRGGRFVAGLPGEQFALPEAVTLLRKKNEVASGLKLVRISAVDPLNLIGLISSDARLPRVVGRGFVLSEGRLVATYEGKGVHLLHEEAPPSGPDATPSTLRNEVETAVRQPLLVESRRMHERHAAERIGRRAENLLI